MKTVLEALKSCVGYPVPKDTIETIAVRRGIYDSLQEEINTQVMGSKAFALCEGRYYEISGNGSQCERGRREY